MKIRDSRFRRTGYGLLAAGSLMLAAAVPAVAQTPFGELDRTSTARVSFSSSERGKPVEAGSQVTVSGEGFRAGQQVSLFYGSTPLNSAPLVADAEGKVSTTIAIPAGAVSGTHPIVVVAQAPYHATVAELKVSPTVPLAGQENYEIATAQVVRGLYQTAYSAKNDVVFAAAAVGRPPVRDSELLKLDADTLGVLARISPAPAPAPERAPPPAQGGDADTRPGLFAVYGIGIDDSKDTVWVTNTRQNTVAVYNQSDLSLVKQFASGAANHSRDVVVDQVLGKAYITPVGVPQVVVIDTGSLEVGRPVEIASLVRGEEFSPTSLSFDAAAHKLYTVSMSTGEVAIIDTRTDTVEKVLPVPGVRNAIGVAHDPQTGRIFVAAQGSDNVVVLESDGRVVADTPVGAGALNVVFDPVERRGYVTNRGAGTITVIDVDGRIVANLGPAPLANHAALGKDGVIYAVDKSSGLTNGTADTIFRIEPK